MGDLLRCFKMQDRGQQAADVTGHCRRLHGDLLPTFHQPPIEGQRERSLGGFNPRVKGGEILDQHEGVRFPGVIQIKTAALSGGGTDHEPIRADGHLGAKAGMAGWLDTEGSCRGL